MTLERILINAKQELKLSDISTADIDVRAIVKYVLRQDDVYLVTHNLDLITNAQYQKFRRMIRRRKRGEPVAYITGHKEFYGLDFKVNKNVLIPRPETEILVQNALEFLVQSSKSKVQSQINIIDIGTGSGCIIISVMKNLSPETYNLKAYAADISTKALSVAKLNAKNHQIYNNIRFFKSDLFSNSKLPKKYDLIIANLPYLKTGFKNLDYEPSLALDGGTDGFVIIERFIRLLPQKLTDDGIALLEVNDFHGPQIEALCRELKIKFFQVENINNWRGIYRISTK